MRKVRVQIVVQTTDPASGPPNVAAFRRGAGTAATRSEGRQGVVAGALGKVRFQSSRRHASFGFSDYSKERSAGGSHENAVAAHHRVAPEPTRDPPPAPGDESAGGVDPGLVPLPIPDTVPEMLTQLSQRTAQIRRFIDQGAFANLYVPAFQAKDLALALDERKNDLPAERRKLVEPAIKRLVRAAWLLDAFGDIGNKGQITAAYSQFAAAVKDVESAFPNQR